MTGPRITDTTVRLVLLTLSCATASVFAGNFVAAYLLAPEFVDTVLGCRGLPVDPGAGGTPSPFSVCLAPHYRHTALVMSALLAVTVGVSVVAFVGLPALVRRRRGLTAPGPAAAAALALVDAEAARIGARPPRVLLDGGRAAATAQVLAGAGRPTLVLSFGMLGLAGRRPDAFGAVVAHELAHIANGDARKTEAALAAWWGLLLGTVVPFAVTAAAAVLTTWSGAGVTRRGAPLLAAVPWGDAVRFVVLAALAVPIRNAVLRVREFAADRAAADRSDAGAPLRDLFAAAGATPGPWSRLTAVHPPAAARRAHLDDPRLGMPVSPWEAVTLGVLAYLPTEAVAILVGYFSYGGPDGLTLPLAAGVAAVSGLGLWAVLWRAALVGACTPRDRLVDGVSLGLGVVASLLLTPGAGFGERLVLLVRSPLFATTALVVVAALTAVTFGAGALAVRWTARRTPGGRGALVAGGVATAAAVAAVFVVLRVLVMAAEGLAGMLGIGGLLVGGVGLAVVAGYAWVYAAVAVLALAVGAVSPRRAGPA